MHRHANHGGYLKHLLRILATLKSLGCFPNLTNVLPFLPLLATDDLGLRAGAGCFAQHQNCAVTLRARSKADDDDSSVQGGQW